MFGPHLIAEAYGCQRKSLSNIELISQLLDEWPTKLGMHKIMPPYVFRYSGAVPEDWGISGIVLIAESHILLHSFVDKKYITLDIFSCKDFDTDEALKLFCDAFKPHHFDHQVLMRGREFPHSLPRAMNILTRERECLTLA